MIAPKIVSHIFSPRIIAYQLRPSLKPSKYGGFTRRPLVTAAYCGVALCTPPPTPIYLWRKGRTILLCYACLVTPLEGRRLQGGLPLLRRQVLRSLGFTTQADIFRPASIRT